MGGYRTFFFVQPCSVAAFSAAEPAEDAYRPGFGRFSHDVGEFREVAAGRAEYFLTHLLAQIVAVVRQVAGQRRGSPCVGQEIGVEISDGPHDGKRQVAVGKIQLPQVIGGRVVGGEGLFDIGIAVGDQRQ